jgi:CxxC motif-containing protein (DUF1111 family)
MNAGSIKSSPLLGAALIAAPAVYGVADPAQGAPPIPDYADAVNLGGDTTDPTASGPEFLFATPAANLNGVRLEKHEEGDLAFADVFKSFQESENSRLDGLGPVFNNASCEACHLRDGRGAPPEADNSWEEFSKDESLLLAISIEGAGAMMCEPNFNNDYCAPEEVPGFGRQLFQRGIPTVRPDSPRSGVADVFVRYESSTVTYADGGKIELREPVFEIRNPYDNPGENPSKLETPVSRVLQADVRMSARLGPPVFGMGLLEAIRQDDLLALADPQDANRDGISGRVNKVFNPALAAAGDPTPVSIGRFGRKAGNATILDQAATALVNDIGITNELFPAENIAATPLHDEYLAHYPEDTGIGPDGQPEAPSDFVELVAFYLQTLHVPARRDVDDPTVRRGSAYFEAAGCAGCHTPRYVTGHHPIAALRNQEIFPFTDLLLHDMGEGLADNRRDFLASGREWRTPPLWGIGLTKVVNEDGGFLHDGRARTLEEAILWHGGEAQAAREYFRNLPSDEREALLAFLESL